MQQVSNGTKARLAALAYGLGTLGFMAATTSTVFAYSDSSQKNRRPFLYAAGFAENAHGQYYLSRYNIPRGTWYGMGAGPAEKKFDRPIYTTLVDERGRVYVTGDFRDKHEHRYLARYTPAGIGKGAIWENLGTGPQGKPINGQITSMIKYGEMLYMAGNFSNNGYFPVYGYNTETGEWTDLGSGPEEAPFNNVINKLAVDSEGRLFAGGDFTRPNGRFYIARYDPGAEDEKWSVFTDTLGRHAINHPVSALAIDENDNLYASGSFTDDDDRPYVARCQSSNTQSCQALGSHSPFTDKIEVIVPYKQNLYAGGRFHNTDNRPYIARFSGSQWHSIGPENAAAFTPGSEILALAAINDRLYVSGTFTDQDNHAYVASYNMKDTTWSTIGSGPYKKNRFNEPVYLTATYL